ncbi:helix-turn-helix domain-containing protein [Treponema primitia]|uniref:helix-turn-helix domain-containing protein n=1 Tax=Treponema primitia TaxID=88058 RepID=UPI000255585C|nr:helix-turn-helix domain-containing protein [Treponema primitia]
MNDKKMAPAIFNMAAPVKTRQEAAQYLRVCLSTLSKLEIPSIKVRRRVLYQQSVLDAWLQDHTQRGDENVKK